MQNIAHLVRNLFSLEEIEQFKILTSEIIRPRLWTERTLSFLSVPK